MTPRSRSRTWPSVFRILGPWLACAFSLHAINCGSKIGTPDKPTETSPVGAGSGGDVAGGSAGGRSSILAGGPNAAGASPSGVCSPGDTRQCVGPAACKGGQTCRDEQWGTCDCGADTSAGGNTGAGLEGGTGGMGGDASPSEGGNSGSGASAGSSGMDPLDEPCPVDAVDIDCSGQCAARASICDGACPASVKIGPLKAGLVIARLPSHPKASCACDDSQKPFIGTQPAAYAMTFQASTAPSFDVHLSVREPWHITSGFATGCAASVTQLKCINNLTLFTVWTSDPDAPAANLVVENGGHCP